MRTAQAMIVLAGVLTASAALATPPSWSNSRHNRGHYDGYDYARVTHVEPIVRQVRVETPRRECWDETQRVATRPHAVGVSTLVGSVIGGVIGHQIGSGRGQDIATVAGAMIGAGVGYNTAARRNPVGVREEVVQRCDVRYEQGYEERIDGYRVTYEYNGRQLTTRMPYDPGDTMRVRVAVAPAQ